MSANTIIYMLQLKLLVCERDGMINNGICIYGAWIVLNPTETLMIHGSKWAIHVCLCSYKSEQLHTHLFIAEADA